MQKSNRIALIVAALIVVLGTLACFGETTQADYEEMAGTPRGGEVNLPTDEPSYSYGDVIGTMGTRYHQMTVSNELVNPVCTDDQARYHLYIGPVNLAAADSPGTGSINGKLHYFRLDVLAVWFESNNGVCDTSRGPSNAASHFIIGGSYDPATYKFTILTCGNNGDVGAGSEIYNISEYKVSGSVVCSPTDQMSWTFSFSDLLLLQGTGTATAP